MAKLPFKISSEIEGKFEVINTTSAILHSRIGDIDFRKITLVQAEELFKMGSRYIKRVKPGRKPAKEPSTG